MRLIGTKCKTSDCLYKNKNTGIDDKGRDVWWEDEIKKVETMG